MVIACVVEQNCSSIWSMMHGSKVHGLEPIVDPSDEIIEDLLAALRWDMQQHSFWTHC
jgi:hypothetical protein